MVDDISSPGEGSLKLPKYLNVHNKLKSPKSVEDIGGEDKWALFRDSSGRVLAQWFDAVANEKDYPSQPQEEDQQTVQNQKVILVVSTDVSRDDSAVTVMPNFGGRLDDSSRDSTTSDDNTNDFYFCNGVMLNDTQLLNDHTYESEFFPCIRKQWYLQPPITDELMDEFTVVNTSTLTNDVRMFLKKNSISIENFAKIYMKRTQGTISDILNHPKKWEELSKKGKETFLKFMEFLSDPNLTSNIKELRIKQEFVCKDKLPSSFIEGLMRGLQPSDKELSDIAKLFRFSIDEIKRYCDLQIALQNNVNQDQEEHISNSVGQYICGKLGCGVVLSGQGALKLHLEKNCEDEVYCSGCDQYFKSHSSYYSHFEHCHKPLMVCSKSLTFDKSDGIPDNDMLLRGNRAQLESQKFICCVCWCGFKSRQRLVKHLTIIHKVGRKNLRPGMTCFVCMKALKNLHALEVHMRIHTKSRPFQCELCKAGFQTKANLQRHTKTHTGEKPYACSYCPARFIEEKALVIHLRTHTGEKPFKCPTCGKCFVHSTPLKLHMLIHEGKKPHACEKCGKHFTQKINLQVHMKRHAGSKKHKCDMCELSFLTKTDFNRHVMMHTGEKPFQCSLCLKTFTRNVYLQDHLRRLLSQTTPKCDVCEKRFCTDATLKRHKRTHTVLPVSDNIGQESKNEKVTAMDTFQATENDNTSNSNIFLLSAKSSDGNDRQYFVMPIQSMEGNSNEIINRPLLPTTELMQNDDGYYLPLSGTEGQHLFLQCVDLSDSSNPLFGANSEFLSSLKDIAIPITISTDDSSSTSALEAGDPNMQSAVSKCLDDSGTDLLTGVTGNSSHSRIQDNLSGGQTDIVMTDSNQVANNPVVVLGQSHSVANAISQNHIPVCIRDLILANNHPPELPTNSCDSPS